MSGLKTAIKQSVTIRLSFFIAFNAALLYALYFIIKNFDLIAVTLWQWLSGALTAFLPLFIGLVLAYLLDPLVNSVEQKLVSRFYSRTAKDPLRAAKLEERRRFLSVLITFLFLVLAVLLLIYAFFVLIVGQLSTGGFASMTAEISRYFSTYSQSLSAWAADLPGGPWNDRLEQAVEALLAWLRSHFNAAAVTRWIAGVGGSMLNLFLGIFVSIYLLKDKAFFKGLLRKFLHLVLPQKPHAIARELLSDIDTVLSRFIRGSLLDALLVAVLSSVGLSLIGLDFAVFIGCFAGLTNIIPYFGPLLGMIPAFIVGAFSGGLTRGVLAVFVLFVVQQIDCNLLYPKIVGQTTGLHPLFVLLAVSIAAYYGGILGMILAVPAAGILQLFALRWTAWMDGRRQEPQ